MRVIAVTSLVACFAVSAAPAAGQAMEMLAHKARYELSLVEVPPSGQIANATGEIRLDWREQCDGWASDLQLLVEITYSEGRGLRFGTRLSGWESKDGLTYDFAVEQRSSSTPVERYSGNAVLQSPGGPGKVTYRQPSPYRGFDLPPGTLFPVAHNLAVLRSIDSDQPILVVPLFDGTETAPEEVAEVSSVVIGERRAPEIAKVAPDYLGNVPAYRLDLAFFREDDAGGAPSQESQVVLFRNGVIGEQTFDFGDFALLAQLKEIEALDPPEC